MVAVQRPGHLAPWDDVLGDARQQAAALRVNVDRTGLENLELPSRPRRGNLELISPTATFGALTDGIRGISLERYICTSMANGRRLATLSQNNVP